MKHALGWLWVLLLVTLLNLVATRPSHRAGELPRVADLREHPVSISMPFPFGGMNAELNRISAMLDE